VVFEIERRGRCRGNACVALAGASLPALDKEAAVAASFVVFLIGYEGSIPAVDSQNRTKTVPKRALSTKKGITIRREDST
jgi:hypothetical protein